MSAPAIPPAARIRVLPEDFVVDEVPLYAPSGEGPHTFVQVEKRLRDTDEVARALARYAGVAARDVGYAGRKDRRAVTRQWFSVPGLAPDRALAFALEGVRVLAASPHRNKLRTGHLRGNRFEVLLREPQPALQDGAGEVLAAFARTGMPNRFGAQRFGRGGDNVARGLAVLRGERGPRGRRMARFLASAVQAEVFNRALAARALPLDALEAGDVAVVHASGGLFPVLDLAAETPRAARFEISATGPIFGTRTPEPEGAPAERERAALAAVGVDPAWLLRGGRGFSLRGARRPLRVQPLDTAVEGGEEGVWLRFTLPSGSYATVLVEELVARIGDSPLAVEATGPALPSPAEGGASP